MWTDSKQLKNFPVPKVMGAPEMPVKIKKQIQSNFKNTIILSVGYDMDLFYTADDKGYTDYSFSKA